MPESIDAGWTEIGGGTVRSDHQRFRLDAAGRRYRFYLVWITELPPGAERVEIGEIFLFQQTPVRTHVLSARRRSARGRSPTGGRTSASAPIPLASHSLREDARLA